MVNQQKIRIVIADDHEVVRRGLMHFLRSNDDFELVGEAANGREAVELCEKFQPDVVLMDIMMPEMDGLTATQIIHEAQPAVHILALTTSINDNVVRDVLRAGASGYLLKNTSIDELAKAIRIALTGKLTLAPEAVQSLIQDQTRSSNDDYRLTEREMEVLALLVKGLNNVEIANRLSLARSTVKFHVSSILGKMNVSSRTEAVSVAIRSNLIK